MTAPVTRRAVLRPLAASDLASVQVEFAPVRGRVTRIGSALEALRDSRLTPAERSAVVALVRAVELLRTRTRFSGIDDAGTAVRLVLRDGDASKRGPWATIGMIAVGSRNGLPARGAGRPRADVLLTVDAAVHELAHVVQFGRMARSVRPNGAILEGIADSVAMLATDDDTLGEGFFHVDAAGRPTGAIRELGGRRVAASTLGGVSSTWAEARTSGTEEHAAGGVVSAAVRDLRARIGRDRAEQLVWAVIRDDAAWKQGGSWRELVLAMRRAAERTWPGDAAVAAALEGALKATGLDAATR